METKAEADKLLLQYNNIFIVSYDGENMV